MRIGGRDLGRLISGLTGRQHYVALANAFSAYARPLEGLRRYLLAQGDYPTAFALNTPTGRREATLYSVHDMLTVNEVFCRKDYAADASLRVAVDFGSNIGLSALYFLTRNPTARVHLFEPAPRNIERLRAQLQGFEDRYVLHEAAVGDRDGEVEFALEDSGRYGGVADRLEGAWAEAEMERLKVPLVSAARVLTEIAEAEGGIDLLKIDVEGFESAILASLPEDLLRRIGVVYAEFDGSGPVPPGMTRRQYGSVAVYRPA
ncbi:MAG: FkbM family methyltransferase [Pseudomonadota bacterium]